MSAGPSPLVIAALAAGGLFLYSRAAQARQAVTGVSAKRTADYFTPTDIAASLARLVVGITKNVSISEPAGIFRVQAPIQAGSPESGLAGWEKYTGSVINGTVTETGDPYNAWSEPSNSSVRVASATQWGSQVDQLAIAPVYDLRTDFVANPFGMFAP